MSDVQAVIGKQVKFMSKSWSLKDNYVCGGRRDVGLWQWGEDSQSKPRNKPESAKCLKENTTNIL